MATRKRKEAPVAKPPATSIEPPPGLAELEDFVDVNTAAAFVRQHPETLKREIRAKRLKAFIPGGKDPRKPGAGQGYRIAKADLEHWYFHGGVPAPEPATEP